MNGEGRQCTVLGGPFELLVQVFMAVAAIATLLYKRHMETPPRRSWTVWSMDCSKQAYASALQHGVNLFLGVEFAASGEASECAWYLCNFAISVGCGILVLSVVMDLYGRCVERYGLTMLRSGEYGTPPSCNPWLAQSLIWGLLASGEKLVTAFAVILPLHSHLDRVAAFMERPMTEYPRLELVVAMVVGPMLLNALFYWIIDSIIMRRQANLHEEVGEVTGGGGTDWNLLDESESSSISIGEPVSPGMRSRSSVSAGAIEAQGNEIV